MSEVKKWILLALGIAAYVGLAAGCVRLVGWG